MTVFWFTLMAATLVSCTYAECAPKAIVVHHPPIEKCMPSTIQVFKLCSGLPCGKGVSAAGVSGSTFFGLGTHYAYCSECISTISASYLRIYLTKFYEPGKKKEFGSYGFFFNGSSRPFLTFKSKMLYTSQDWFVINRFLEACEEKRVRGNTRKFRTSGLPEVSNSQGKCYYPLYFRPKIIKDYIPAPWVTPLNPSDICGPSEFSGNKSSGHILGFAFPAD